MPHTSRFSKRLLGGATGAQRYVSRYLRGWSWTPHDASVPACQATAVSASVTDAACGTVEDPLRRVSRMSCRDSLKSGTVGLRRFFSSAETALSHQFRTLLTHSFIHSFIALGSYIATCDKTHSLFRMETRLYTVNQLW